VLAGKAVTTPTTPVAGCFIARAKKAKEGGAVTFNKHVARILQKNCQECHRPGQIGPMPLLTYEDAAAWADTIREVVEDGRMPPWHADPRFGKFSNDRRLAPQDNQPLLPCVNNGTPRSRPQDLAPPGAFSREWKIGTPDVVLTMPKEFEVPAEMPKLGIPYQYFTVPTNFEEDRWVVRAETRPGAPEVVHHIVVFIAPPGERFFPGNPRSPARRGAP